MGRSEREKGRKGEAEVAAIFRARGLEVRGLEATGDHLLVCAGRLGLTLHSEVKRQETARVWLWWEQASSEAPPGAVPMVTFRRNHSPWLTIIATEELALLLEDIEALERLVAAEREPAG
jgi:Holliday junction resolvase